MNQLLLTEIVQTALIEDLGTGDITSEAIFEEGFPSRATLIAKSPGIIAGLRLVETVYRLIDPCVSVTFRVADGQKVKNGEKIGEIAGNIKSILGGERVALNFLQRLSGIATQTNCLVELISSYPTKIVDTRKTTPGLRMLEKYAVRQGGGSNHRFNLADAVLIKDNHIAACGSIKEAVVKTRHRIPHTMTIEVEAENESQVREALDAKADIILLDNMSPAEMAEMVRLIRAKSANGRPIIEASGNINENNVKEIAASGVDIISSGALTHSVKALDISLEVSLENL